VLRYLPWLCTDRSVAGPSLIWISFYPQLNFWLSAGGFLSV
jgi:hypothetical protein